MLPPGAQRDGPVPHADDLPQRSARAQEQHVSPAVRLRRPPAQRVLPRGGRRQPRHGDAPTGRRRARRARHLQAEPAATAAAEAAVGLQPPVPPRRHRQAKVPRVRAVRVPGGALGRPHAGRHRRHGPLPLPRRAHLRGQAGGPHGVPAHGAARLRRQETDRLRVRRHPHLPQLRPHGGALPDLAVQRAGGAVGVAGGAEPHGRAPPQRLAAAPGGGGDHHAPQLPQQPALPRHRPAPAAAAGGHQRLRAACVPAHGLRRRPHGAERHRHGLGRHRTLGGPERAPAQGEPRRDPHGPLPQRHQRDGGQQAESRHHRLAALRRRSVAQRHLPGRLWRPPAGPHQRGPLLPVQGGRAGVLRPSLRHRPARRLHQGGHLRALDRERGVASRRLRAENHRLIYYLMFNDCFELSSVRARTNRVKKTTI